ncbi:diguanylate cyclase [Luteimonas composti]|uniref:diguanylate cyclase n=1 Tax=Luteimonas composti TaxID=398257 RepID=A0ABT6MPR2_9GAMM|nr:diguanylate cyclase [Luteimonas composti]MDH7452439.1 diguanylate cyclase [Luteimonas composti]
MAWKWTRALDGNIASLERGERRNFFVYAYRNTAASRTALTFGLPLLFLIGWTRDYAVSPAMAMESLPRRLLLFSLLVAMALLIRARLRAHWREAALVGYACVFSAGIAMTTLAEPERMSLTHVAAVLTTIIVLPFALHRATAAAVIVAFSIPLFAMLAIQGAGPALFLAYAGYTLVGVGIGLGYRRVWLDTSLDVFQLRQRLLSRIHVDSLTGLLNREGWQTRAVRAFERALSEQRRVAVAYFDLDHFKRANDTHGHAMGDMLLRTVAKTLREQCRAGELVARVGGEEFLALLPDAGEDDAYACAERVRRAVAALPGPIPASVSCGVAACQAGEPLELAVARADAAMLEAKRRGRNLVLRADAHAPPFTVAGPAGE